MQSLNTNQNPPMPYPGALGFTNANATQPMPASNTQQQNGPAPYPGSLSSQAPLNPSNPPQQNPVMPYPGALQTRYQQSASSVSSQQASQQTVPNNTQQFPPQPYPGVQQPQGAAQNSQPQPYPGISPVPISASPQYPSTQQQPQTVQGGQPQPYPGTASQIQQQGQYTIKSGDTFDAIAAMKGTTANVLQALNPGMAATDLGIGALLNLPGQESFPRNPQPQPFPASQQQPQMPFPPQQNGQQQVQLQQVG
jgi:hypothetical protein